MRWASARPNRWPGCWLKAGYENIRITRDTGGIDRVVEGQRPKEQEIPDLLHETLEEEG